MSKKTLGPSVDQKTLKWYEQNFDNTNRGARYILDSFPGIFERTLRDLRGVFTFRELSLILDVQNGCFLIPQIAGHHLFPNVDSGMSFDQLDQKWEIDRPEIIKKIRGLKLFEIAVLEIWAAAFWKQDEPNLEQWVSGLAKRKEGKNHGDKGLNCR